MTKDGEWAACARASSTDSEPPAKCRALLRVGLVPLVEDATWVNEPTPVRRDRPTSTEDTATATDDTGRRHGGAFFRVEAGAGYLSGKGTTVTNSGDQTIKADGIGSGFAGFFGFTPIRKLVLGPQLTYFSLRPANALRLTAGAFAQYYLGDRYGLHVGLRGAFCDMTVMQYAVRSDAVIPFVLSSIRRRVACISSKMVSGFLIVSHLHRRIHLNNSISTQHVDRAGESSIANRFRWRIPKSSACYHPRTSRTASGDIAATGD